MKDKIVTGGVIIALALSGLAFFGGTDGIDGIDGRDGRVGAQSGPDHYSTQYFQDNFYVGDGSYATTSDVAAATLTAVELDCDVSYVSFNAGLNITLTTQASTSQPFKNMRVGQSCSTLFYSATTTAATTITFAAGTGVDLQEDEGGTVIVNGLESARLTYVKKADTDILLVVEPYQVGD